VQLGTTAAIVLYFWRELLQVTVAWFKGLWDPSVRHSLEYKLGWYLILATVPVAVFGLVFSDQIETGARNLWLIACTLIALAIVLAAAERVGRRDRVEEQLNTTDAIVVGAAQALALVPSGGYEAINPGAGKTPGTGLIGVAVIMAFLVGLASIAWLMRWLSNHSTFVFIYYRIAMGVLLIVLLSTGVLHATR
jgi:undecaprenyl-diphosphatase